MCLMTGDIGYQCVITPLTCWDYLLRNKHLRRLTNDGEYNQKICWNLPQEDLSLQDSAAPGYKPSGQLQEGRVG